MKNIIEIQEEVKIGNVILEKGDRIRVLNERSSYWTVIEQGKTTRWGNYDNYEHAEEKLFHMQSMYPRKDFMIAVDDNGILKNEYGEPIVR